MRDIPLATHPSNGRNHYRAIQRDMLGYVEHIAQQGDFLRIPIGPLSLLFVNAPDLTREILVSQATKFNKPSNVKQAARGLFGENLFTADGDVWRTLRLTMSPSFHARHIASYRQIMVDCTAEMLQRWQSGSAINAADELMTVTLATTTRALFGRDLTDERAEQAIIRFIELFFKRISGLPIPAWLPTKLNRDMKAQIEMIDAAVMPLIKARRAAGHVGNDLLALLLEARRVDETGIWTDEQVRNELLNVYAAGYEVTANSLAFTLYLLTQHPDTMKQLRIQLAAADTPEDVPLLDHVLQEAMRLLPVTAVVSRQTAEPVTLRGVTIPKNRLVLIAPWVLHRHPDVWDEPDRFKPERFEGNINKYAYLPFSTGPRICIGRAFAMLQMKINLAMILQHCDFETDPNWTFEPTYTFNTRLNSGLPLIIL